ncbi:TatD family hydrolase [Arachidicoccus ginsenosidivorans]|uniref:TatD family deoxyribonuclease n=1 Tax=Arachidicoccus ginsenosidivorans TaxID=496057 RepID=A0A5B8VJ84_9BACT|nr:TatD family hydrolase [Arachidicoccus ginsenosidivorans]QEC71520.1 TatD family deoxyribonuclease [Arachidicoccus ginsenosidivorans]
MQLIDTHTHLYSEEFKNDLPEVMQRADKASIKQFYLPAIDSSTHEAMIALEVAYPDSCHAMMGLHPCSVKEDFQKELNIIKDWLDKRPFVAIGEIGLDFYWDKTHIEQQYEAFKIQMEWALERDLPIAIHARESLDECIATVKPFSKRGLKGIFHCFGGTTEQAKAIIDLNFYLGIGGVFTFKKANMPEVLKDISLNHIVLETDAPYLAPVPYRGKRNESAYLLYVAEALANSKEISLEELANITTGNAKKIFKAQ